MKKTKLTELTTPFEGQQDHGWDIYPRPQMKRNSFLCLNGLWNLSLKTREAETKIGGILVPFPPESKLGGIRTVGSQSNGPIITKDEPEGRSLAEDEQWIYERNFDLDPIMEGSKALLHFGAVDQIAKVFVDDQYLGEHKGGYLPFSFDITWALNTSQGEEKALSEKPFSHRLRVEVVDTLDPDLPYGKQRKDRGGMWYTPFSGIWQSVWLEVIPETAFTDVHVIPSLTSIRLEVKGGLPKKTLTIHQEVGDFTISFEGSTLETSILNPHVWTTEDPYLYTFTLTDGKDTIESYFALRTFTIENGHFLLNGQPIFLHGLLDQGFYSDGISLPGSPEGYTFDIQTMKQLGFNLLRKHIKIEPDWFYYECDRLGMLVMQDLVNSGPYDFFKDTILPTVGLNSVFKNPPSNTRRGQFEKDAEITLDLLKNHPCVIGYTIFNEGWGQYDADRLYEALKAKDPSRFFDATSGWFEGEKSDVTSRHVYFKPLNIRQFRLTSAARRTAQNDRRPLFLSEFGGYAYKVDGHILNPEKEYGYRKIPSKEALEEAVVKLYMEQVVPLISQGLAGAILTQVSDVEDEINGLVTYDRQVIKVDAEPMREVAAAIRKACETWK